MNYMTFPRLKTQYLIQIIFYILIFVILLGHSYSYLDPDLGWHLKTGQEIWQNQAVPKINTINYTLPNSSWADHEWLANLGLYRLYQHNFGYLLINIIFALIPVLGLLLINRRFNFNANPGFTYLMLGLEITAVIAMAPHFGVRLQEISFLGLAILISIFDKYRHSQKWPKLLWLLPLFLLWANLHAGFLLGLIILGIFTIFHYKNWRLWLISLGAVLITLANPYGLQLYGFLLGYRSTYYLSHIMEWLPQWSWPYKYWQVAWLATISLFLGLTWVYKKYKPKLKWPIDYLELIILLLLFVLAWKSRRNFPLLMVVALPWTAKFLQSFFPELGQAKTDKKSKTFLIVEIFLILGLTSILVLQASGLKINKNPFTSFCEDKYSNSPNQILYPCGATKWLQGQDEYQKLRLLNRFGWGGYLIWQYPEKQLFIDGRMPQAPYKNYTILEEYNSIEQEAQVAGKLKEHQIDLVMIEPAAKDIHLNWLEKNILLINEEEINKNRQRNALRDYLESSPEWQKVYSDPVAIIYAQKQ